MNKGPIYLSGPIADCSDIEVFAWRYEAERLLGKAYVLDPAKRDYRNRQLGFQEKRDLVDYDLADISNCVGVLCNYWKITSGTTMELVYAKLYRKPVVVVAPFNVSLSPWVEYHCDDVSRYGIADGILRLKRLLRWDREEAVVVGASVAQ